MRYKKKLNQHIYALLEINMILWGTSVDENTSNRKRNFEKHILIMTYQQDPWYKDITFILEDKDEVAYPNKDILFIFMALTNHHVHKVLMDNESLVNILYNDIMS